jgi:hypothetical protein
MQRRGAGAHRARQLGGALWSTRQLIGEVQFGGCHKRAANPGSGDHLNQTGVRRNGLRRDMVLVCHCGLVLADTLSAQTKQTQMTD